MKQLPSLQGDSNLRRAAHALAALLVSVAFAWPSLGADWPTYRGDAGRSGYTADTLPSKLTSAWQRTATHAPGPAWSGRDTRMPFDQAYHTVIADGISGLRCFKVPSGSRDPLYQQPGLARNIRFSPAEP